MTKIVENVGVSQWASAAKRGERYTYHLGECFDYKPQPSEKGKHQYRHPALREAWDLYELGLVTLTQKLLHRNEKNFGTYAYIATKI